MSICSTNSRYESFEYNPCIRKGKHKIIYKKLKKYEAKVQKMNLIRPKRGKLISNKYDLITSTNSEMFKNMIKILENTNELEWNEDYDFLFKYTFRFAIDDELEKKYAGIQQNIIENKLYQDYEDYEDYEDYYERCIERLRYDHMFR